MTKIQIFKSSWQSNWHSGMYSYKTCPVSTVQRHDNKGSHLHKWCHWSKGARLRSEQVPSLWIGNQHREVLDHVCQPDNRTLGNSFNLDVCCMDSNLSGMNQITGADWASNISQNKGKRSRNSKKLCLLMLHPMTHSNVCTLNGWYSIWLSKSWWEGS